MSSNLAKLAHAMRTCSLLMVMGIRLPWWKDLHASSAAVADPSVFTCPWAAVLCLLQRLQ